MAFNTNLIQKRKEKGINQEDLANQIGVTRQAVSKWETGESLPDIYKLSALADALDVSIDSLCDREPPAAKAEVLPTPEHKSLPLWKKALSVFTLVALLAISFLGGAYIGRQTAQEHGASLGDALPDLITVSGLRFSGSGGTLRYQFVPSVTGEEYTYQISFLGASSDLSTYDAFCQGGVCTGQAVLTPGERYTVSFTVSNGEESRTVCLTSDLILDAEGGASWSGQ